MSIKYARATIFGGSGFIGRHIVQRLARRGTVVRVAVRDPEAALSLKPMGQVGQIVPVYADVRDEKSVKAAVDGVDVVINAVSLIAESGRDRFGDVHVRGALHVARQAAAAGARRLVHVSGLGVDIDSDSLYVRARTAGETAVFKEFPQATILRPSVVFGPGDHFFTTLAMMARLSPVMPLFSGGTAKLQPVYVGDVADAALKALDDPATAATVFELGGPAVYTYRELMEVLLHAIGRKRALVAVPGPAARIMATFAGLLPSPPITRDQLKLLAADNVVAPGAADLAALGIAPTAIEVILPTYMDRYRRGGRWRNTRFA